jgi:hypothetical protein
MVVVQLSSLFVGCVLKNWGREGEVAVGTCTYDDLNEKN